jgi:2-phospho-L-lactate guanylyltransferase
VIVTVIPAKPFIESKTRLSTVLSSSQRAWLSRSLLAHTIVVAAQLSQVVVVSRSAAVRRAAKQLGAYALVEGQADLNVAIRQGIAWGQARGGSSVLILPLDLPRLSTAVLEELLKLGSLRSPGIVIAPCRHRRGTNALFLTPPTLISPRFGPNSFRLHQELAYQAGVLPKIYHTPELAFDLDTPEDWEQISSSGSLTSSYNPAPDRSVR